MTRNNAIVPKKKARKRAKQQGVARAGVNGGLMIPRPFKPFTYTNPGRATLRTTFEAFPPSRHFDLSYFSTQGVAAWFPTLYAMLGPFAWWRVSNVRFTTHVNGGAASAYTVCANVSNNSITFDGAATAILDDEYAGVANATSPLVLMPPTVYWTQGNSKWYPCAGTTGAAVDANQGTLSVIGFGATDTTVIGWHTVEVEFEFHTLL